MPLLICSSWRAATPIYLTSFLMPMLRSPRQCHTSTVCKAALVMIQTSKQFLQWCTRIFWISIGARINSSEDDVRLSLPFFNVKGLMTDATAWYIFFDSLWKSFEIRFDGILAKLSRHREMLTKEAIAIDIVEARRWRAQALDDLEIREKRRVDIHMHDTIAWLNVQQEHQDDELDRLLSKRQPGTCDWVFRHTEFLTWQNDAHADPILWVKGIPGAGT